MDEVTVKVIPVAPENMRFCGGTKYINIFNNEGINMNGDYIKVYKLQGKKWKCLAQIKKAKLSNGKVFTVKKLKPGKNYKFKFKNYDSKTKMESPMSKTFTAVTAVSGVPKIKSVSSSKISVKRDAIVHNPGKITEWREPYNVYCSSVKITVSKVKVTSG